MWRALKGFLFCRPDRIVSAGGENTSDHTRHGKRQSCTHLLHVRNVQTDQWLSLLTVQSWRERTAWPCWMRSWAAPPWTKVTSLRTGRICLETTRRPPARLRRLRNSRRKSLFYLLSCWTTASPLTPVLYQVGQVWPFCGNHGNIGATLGIRS